MQSNRHLRLESVQDVKRKRASGRANKVASASGSVRLPVSTEGEIKRVVVKRMTE